MSGTGRRLVLRREEILDLIVRGIDRAGATSLVIRCST
jgi:hypothetical protein